MENYLDSMELAKSEWNFKIVFLYKTKHMTYRTSSSVYFKYRK